VLKIALGVYVGQKKSEYSQGMYQKKLSQHAGRRSHQKQRLSSGSPNAERPHKRSDKETLSLKVTIGAGTVRTPLIALIIPLISP